MLGRRWLWGILAAAATSYFLRRTRRTGMRMGSRMRTVDAYRMGQSAVDAVVRAGRSIAESAMRALARTRV